MTPDWALRVAHEVIFGYGLICAGRVLLRCWAAARQRRRVRRTARRLGIVVGR